MTEVRISATNECGAEEAVDTVSQAGSESPSTISRGGWGSPIEFVLACLGYAVGLGNVWRFPYLCYRNGGGAFLIPYLIMLIVIGLPIFYLELYCGQYSAIGPIDVFSRIAPGFWGLGYCTLMVITLIIMYYMIIVAWTLYYTFMSFDPNLGWGSCDHVYNTMNCYSGSYENDCKENNPGTHMDQVYYNKTCTTVEDICEKFLHLKPILGDNQQCMDEDTGNTILWRKTLKRVLASEEYYNEQVLGKGNSTWEDFGDMQWHLVGCLALAWVIAFLCVIKGVQSAGKVVYFTALFPYVMLTALLVRGVTLPGAEEGILFYITPQWELLGNANVWGDAASQIFYSFGVGCGSLITLASYNKFNNNCHFDACIVSFANFFTSIFAGFAIFSVLGFQAQSMGVSVSEVAQDGPGLAFVAYPEAILQMPVPQLWAILFFFMLFILGLGSQFAGIEAVNTAIIDHYPKLRAQKWKVTAGTCFTCFLLGLPMCTSGGVYLFTLLDWNTASWAILLIGVGECASVAWCYGASKALDDLNYMGMKLGCFLRGYWWLVWTILTPVACVAVFIFSMIQKERASYEDYIFPAWADAIGWMIGLSTIVPMPLGLLWIVFKKKVRGKALITPTEEWAPVVPRPKEDEVGSVKDLFARDGELGKTNEGFMP
ncbi:sodium- and chloride-dependent glycine transporter 1-like [Arctopsyche grandis]|uniref:sodium- and chloride-dependent glycine transporter 1-like n=1 Tax=Arctopsyche grandis TaxID=121162 RepID=UPI00406D6C96